MKRLKYLALTGVALTVGVLVVIEKVLPLTAVKPWRVAPRDHRWLFPHGYRPEDFGLQGELWTVQSPDGVALKAWFIPAAIERPRGTVVLLHGRSNCKESQLERAQMAVGAGFNCVVMDLRAHGESGGDYCTYGHYEKYDVGAVVDAVRQRVPDGPIGIWGLSLGGAVALQTLAIDERLQFGIIESTFDELPNVVMEYGADYMFGWRSRWLADRVLEKCAVLAAFDPQSIKPVEAAATIRRPMLFIHGTADDKIPPGFNRRNFDAVPTATKQWISVEGAGHRDVWEKGGAGLRTEIQAFLDAKL